jgi:tryptophan halogenase
MQNKINNVVIVGGGTAGWMTANLLAKMLGKSINVTLLESNDIATVGVGEATIPPIRRFNRLIGVNEHAFMQACKATIKLGIQFENWLKPKHSYMHAFGTSLIQKRNQVDNLIYWDFSLNYQAAINNKFQKLKRLPNTNMPGIVYAYHFDAGLYAKFLAEHGKQQGVNHLIGTVKQVNQNHETGFIESLLLDDDTQLSGDLFIDCTGMHALLIEKTLNTGYEDWSHWLPCDRAMAVPSENAEIVVPYTRSIAHHVGWQWQIPLQHRMGNGLVYSSKHISDEEAKKTLLGNLPGKPLSDPRIIKFRTGCRRKTWNKNVISIGLSSGFLEPLESTNIHLVQYTVGRLIGLFPHNGISKTIVDQFNRSCKTEIESIRDLIILHYKVNVRSDSAFWRQCQQMDIPDTLTTKIELFKQTGKVHCRLDDLFDERAWRQVMLGQGITPDKIHLVDGLSYEQTEDMLESLRTLIDKTVENMPTHQDYLMQFKEK